MSDMVDDLLAAGVPDHEIDRLLAQWGGLPLYVPRQIDGSHPLVQVAGPSVAAALVRLRGGERIIVPMGARWRRRRLSAAVRDLSAAGLTGPEIARRLGLHLRQVQRLLALARSEKS